MTLPDTEPRESPVGHYARKQLHCPSRVVAWSHGSRFDRARQLAGSDPAGRLLDYGCGDGTFVAMIHERFASVRGVDLDAGQIEDCRRRLGHLPRVSFGVTGDLGAADAGGWTVVTCMEVLEHCLEDQRRRIIRQLATVCAPGGRVIVSVPIETGPALAGKHLFRALAGLRRLGDYRHRERYSPMEMARSLSGLPIARPIYRGEHDTPYHGHKGFEWREVQRELASCLTIEQRQFTPLGWAGALLNSQAWFVCRRTR